MKQALARVLGLDARRLNDPSQGFFDMGMDSLTAIEFRNALQASLAMSLPSTLAFDYPSLERLVDYLCPEEPEPAWPAPVLPLREETESSREMIEHMSDEEAERLLLEKLAMQ